MTPSNLHIAWARVFLRALSASGVTDIVLSPGSRSTPLALATAREPAITTHVVVDERSAAFFALGQARVTGRPSVLVCTSGTAGAHYLPAVIEASLAHLPLVVVTADRPWEVQDCASPQTIPQSGLFGHHVRHRAALGEPDASPAALRAVSRIAAQAVFASMTPTPGPVHINAAFRKPLEPVEVHGPEPWAQHVEALHQRGAARVFAPVTTPDPLAIEDLAAHCRHASRGLIVCGPAPANGDLNALRSSVQALARATGFPLLAEATSQVRFGSRVEGVTVCAGFDTVLRDAGFRRTHAPDLVIELGAPPTSSAWAQYLANHPDAPRYVVAEHGWNDPSGDATAMVMADPVAVCTAVAARLHGDKSLHGTRAWAAAFAEADARAWSCVAREVAEGVLTEGIIARSVASAMPAHGLLAVGNSMPVRDLDTYVPMGRVGFRVLHQRGASGIDGLVSGAAGAASIANVPVVLLLGDLSFQHDLGGLAAARAIRGPLVMVVVQNHGGRIFQQLPLAARSETAEVMERLFVTPQPLDIAAAASMFGHRYRRANTVAALEAALAEALSAGGCTVIEAVVPPCDATARRAALYDAFTRGPS